MQKLIGPKFIPLPAHITNATQWIESKQNNSKQTKESHINNIIEKNCPIQAHETEMERIKAEIARLENICKRGDIFDLECRYILKKDKIPEPWQEYIEKYLIMALENNFENKGFRNLKYISSYPTHTKTLYEKDLFVSKPSFAEKFLLGKKHLEAIFNDDLQMPKKVQKNWINIFKKIAKAAEDKKRYFAYCQTEDTDSFEIAASHIAKLMDVRFKVIDAGKEEINFELLFGSEVGSKEGSHLGILTHLFFNAGDNETYLNPILIIQNFDQCANDKNMPWKQLFDNEIKTYKDAYLDLEIDVSQLSIIISGTTPHKDLNPTLRDRFEKISF